MNKDTYDWLLRESRTSEDPSAHEEYALEPAHKEVQYLIKEATGVEIDIQSTRHNVVLSLSNDIGGFSMSLEHSDFNDVEGVVVGVLECFEEDADLLDLLVESGYRVARK